MVSSFRPRRTPVVEIGSILSRSTYPPLHVRQLLRMLLTEPSSRTPTQMHFHPYLLIAPAPPAALIAGFVHRKQVRPAIMIEVPRNDIVRRCWKVESVRCLELVMIWIALHQLTLSPVGDPADLYPRGVFEQSSHPRST
jgi:hypothetical protein